MIKLFYQDKTIIFSSQDDSFDAKTEILENSPSIAQITPFLEQQEKVIVIKSNSTQEAFNNFSKDFKIVTACGGLVENSSEEVLMIHRNGRWDIPKGKIENDETFGECAIREVMEETGIDNIKTIGEPITTLHCYNIYGCWELKKTYWYKMQYIGEPKSEGDATHDFTPQQEEGITECRWVKREELNELTKDSYATIKYIIHNLN